MGDRFRANCSIRLDGSSFVLTYRLGKNLDKKKVEWNWHSEDGKFVAKLEYKTEKGDIKYHNSAAIDSSTHAKLGEPDKSVDGEYFIVKLKKLSSDVPDLKEFFNVD